ncbi:phosphoglycerate mutase family [Naviculisporaceae sp. PSN 640]
MSDSSPTIYLVRHAESEHNVTKDFSIRDPGLTELGFKQASSLATGSFPALNTTAIVLSSPLRRTIETTLAGFGQIIDGLASHFTKEAGTDTYTATGGKAKLILDPDLQERSDLPCDTGSPVSALTEKFPLLASLSPSPFEVLGQGEWFAKTGAYTSDDEAVAARAKKVRGRLLGLVKGLQADGAATGKKDIVVVTHGVFMKFLSGDQTIDLPKAGWKAFKFVEGGEDLVPVEV